MNKIQKALVLILLALMPLSAFAQDVAALPPAPAPATYSPDQLEQIAAPIALYPDPLVAQILMAATYPLEIVEAARWLQNPANAAMQGDELADALAQQPWDPSVKSLLPFPQVLQTLDRNIEWTEQLGNAFLAQQADVMNAIQHLRYEAEQNGALRSTPQQVVTAQGPDILIQPANPDYLYVPYYNPSVVYGAWPYPDYPPYYFTGYSAGVGLGFFAAVAIVAPLWGWHHWDWRDHRIVIDDARFARLDEGRAPPRGNVWRHDPDHRHGVPYANAAVRSRFAAANTSRPAPNGNFRGYETRPSVAPAVVHAPNAAQFRQETARPADRPQTIRPAAAPAAMPRAEPQIQHAAPMYESFTHGQDVRQQQMRGMQSRTPPPQSHAAAPASHPAPQHAAGGGHAAGGNEREGH